jgi:hypothetical protein
MPSQRTQPSCKLSHISYPTFTSFINTHPASVCDIQEKFRPTIHELDKV